MNFYGSGVYGAQQSHEKDEIYQPEMKDLGDLEDV
jgi:hypothetical protein